MNKSDYPIILNAKHIQEIMGIGVRRSYEIMDLKGFPKIQIGRTKRVERDKFFEWLEKQTG